MNLIDTNTDPKVRFMKYKLDYYNILKHTIY